MADPDGDCDDDDDDCCQLRKCHLQSPDTEDAGHFHFDSKASRMVD